MKKNMTVRRCLALMLCMLMVLGMMPLTTFAAKEMFLTNELSSVSVYGVTPPAAQSNPDMTAQSVREDRYQIVDLYWTPAVNASEKIIKIEEDEFFDTDSSYTVHIILRAVGDYSFKLNADNTSAVTATLNNSISAGTTMPPEEYRSVGYDKCLEVYYTFPATDASVTVNHVALTVDAPVAGQKVQNTDMLFSEEMIGKVNYLRQNNMKLAWYHDNTEMAPGDAFVYGEEYLAMVKLYIPYNRVQFAVDPNHALAFDGYPYTAVTATVNGDSDNVVVMPNNTEGNAYTHINVSKLFVCETRQKIDTVDISGIAAPVTGEQADYTAEMGANTYTLQDKNNAGIKNGIYWTVKDENNVSQYDLPVDDSIFAPETIYAVTVKVVPAENYEFAADAQVSFNGMTAANVTVEPDEIRISYTFPATEAVKMTEIDTVAINGLTAPAAGKHPDYTAKLGDVTYQLKEISNTTAKNGIIWSAMDLNNGPVGDLSVTDDTFEDNCAYAVTVTVVPADETHIFAPDVKVTINGKTPNHVTVKENEIIAAYVFPILEADPIESIAIAGVDLTPDNPDVPLNGKETISNDKVTLTEFLWDTLPASNWRYGIADLMMTSEEGYIFTDDTVVTVNGYYAEKFYIAEDGHEAVYRCIFAPVFLEDPATHEHFFRYATTPFEHWLECDCGYLASVGDHEMDKNNQCTVCDYKVYDITTLPFTDVKTDDYFAQAVGWAYENNITAGTSETTFSPDMTCTRAQVVTFLWRAAGCPEPQSTKNPFKDVKKTDWYYKAVLWAVEENITVGTSETEFSPDMECSTAIILTFLFRAVGAGSNGWYEEAAAWAESLDLMYATNLTVDPNTPCPRKAIVTFLYRVYG